MAPPSRLFSLFSLALAASLLWSGLQATAPRSVAGRNDGLPLAVPIVVDLSLPSSPIHRELLGQFIPNPRRQVFDPDSGQRATAEVATYLRGLYGAFYADYYDWRDPLGLNDPLRPASGRPEVHDQIGTLDYLRLAAANRAAVSLNVNARGVRDVFTQPLEPGLSWVMTDTATLAGWAADWVLYTNYTLQVYDSANPPDPGAEDALERRSASILEAITWQNRDGSNVRPELPEPGERLPVVTYWEIGNEPNFALSGFRLRPADYAVRYLAITNAMIAVDVQIHGERTIRVGPSLTATYPPARNSIRDYVAALEEVGAVVDFVAYHPYTTLFGPWEWGPEGVGANALPAQASDFTPQQVDGLRAILSGLYGFHETLAISTTLAAPAGAELLASEWNPGSWQSTFGDLWKGKSMAQALGAMETVFAFARLELRAASFYTSPAFPDNDRQQPLYETFAFLKKNLGNRLVLAYGSGDVGAAPYRAYVTRHSGPASVLPGAIVLWGLNWGQEVVEFDFQLEGLVRPYLPGKRCELAAPGLLHGAWETGGAPPLDAPLGVVCSGQAEVLQERGVWKGKMGVRLQVPANAWVALVLWPQGADWGGVPHPRGVSVR